MVKHLLKWISGIFSKSKLDTNHFCLWCHSKSCPYRDYRDCQANKLVESQRCPYHDDVMPPPYCHRCPDSWTKWTKPTIYRPDPNRYDRRLCLDWICESCDKREEEHKELEIKRYNNTREAAELSFTQKGNDFFYYGQPVFADFIITYESLAPFVTKIHDIAYGFLDCGIDWESISIREGCVYIRNDTGEYKGD